MVEAFLVLVLVLLVAVIVMLALVFRRPAGTDLALVLTRLETLEKSQERTERGVKEEFGRSRQETAGQARGLREEVQGSLKNSTDLLVQSVDRISAAQKQQLDSFAAQLTRLTESNEKKSDQLRAAVEAKLTQLQADNARKLEEMRHTVDEKLQGTLEKRLGESFKLVSERLEQVHKGLGEMQTLASGVGDLKRVLTNVKTRGTWGEIQLGSLLEQILTPDQYAKCHATPTYCDQSVLNPFFWKNLTPGAAASQLLAFGYATSQLGGLQNIPVKILMNPFPQFFNSLFSNTEPIGYADYNSLQMKIDKRVSGGGLLINGLNFRTSFTWSRSMVTTFVNNSGVSSGAGGQGGLRDANLSWRVGDNDRTFDLGFNLVWNLPFGRNGFGRNTHGVVRQLISDWTWDAILTADTGTPIGTLPQDNTYSSTCSHDRFQPDHRGFAEWLYNESPTCWSVNSPYTARTQIQRVSYLRNPYAPQLAMAMSKKLVLREGLDLMYKVEAFNLTNTPIFGGPSLGSPNAAPSPVGGITPGQPGSFTGFGTIGSTQQNSPRQLQMSLKVLF